MTCREVIEFLIDYVDGTLPARELEQFERHLALCDSCTAYLHTYQLTIRLEKRIDDGPIDPPEELVRAVLATRSS